MAVFSHSKHEGRQEGIKVHGGALTDPAICPYLPQGLGKLGSCGTQLGMERGLTVLDSAITVGIQPSVYFQTNCHWTWDI